MSRKQFEAIAAALRKSSASLETCKAIASILAKFNSAFDRQRFLTASGF